MKDKGLHHPGRWLWLVLLVPVLVGYHRLQLDTEMLHLLPRSLPAVEGLLLYQEHFTSSRELFITIESPSEDAADGAAETVGTALRSATGVVAHASWKAPWLESPGQMGEFLAFIWLNRPPETFQTLVSRLVVSNATEHLREVKAELATSLSAQSIARGTYDPFGFTELPEQISGLPSLAPSSPSAGEAGSHVRIVQVNAVEELTNYNQCEAWLARVKQCASTALREAGFGADTRLGFTGRPAFVAEIAKGMERDLRRSVLGTAAVIALLFWFAHRRFKPLLWLMTLLALVVAASLGLGGFLFGEVNVISLGFAAILLGLGVDYALVQYHEATARPNASVSEVRGVVQKSVLGAAATTVAAFLALNLCGLPGLAQLGTLVAIGVALSAVVMLLEYLPPLKRGLSQLPAMAESEPGARPRWNPVLAWGATALLGVGSVTFLAFEGLPLVDTSPNALKPRNSPAYATLEKVQRAMGQERDPLWLLTGGQNEAEVAAKLNAISSVLNQACSNGLVSEFMVPNELWPNPDYQRSNMRRIMLLLDSEAALAGAAREEGFTEDALKLLHSVFAGWKQAAELDGVFWPQNGASQAILDKFAAANGPEKFALSLVRPTAGKEAQVAEDLRTQFPQRTWLTGWSLLGGSVLQTVETRFALVFGVNLLLALGSLWLTFRRWAEVLLSAVALGLSALLLLALMRVFGWKWNLMSLMSIPLIVGTGVDYSIFVQVGLGRCEGQWSRMFNSTGKALLLCAATSIAGFGSLWTSTNAGIASLGPLCALGIALNLFVAIYLVPCWWRRFVGISSPSAGVDTPSSLYRSGVWGLGRRLSGALPQTIVEFAAWFCSLLYRVFSPRRYAIVRHNSLPALDNDPGAARATAKRLFRNFARKLIHLWRFEDGLSVAGLLVEHSGWEHLEGARANRRGILLVTLHVGNWELGAAWLAAKGIDLQVITLSEPGETFTRQREAARARWGVRTLVVGSDPFGSVEVIRQLQDGGTVALLVDRPPERTAIEVKLFGRSFPASVAAAELARASGCQILPVYIVAKGEGYSAHILPAIPYERAALRQAAARGELTQEILRAFEPVLRQHADQWYHFVPVWELGPRARMARKKTG